MRRGRLLALAFCLLLPALRAAADDLDDMGRPLEFKPKKYSAAPAPGPAASLSKPAPGGAEKELLRLSDTLKLDDVQQAKLRPLLEERWGRLEQLRKQLKDAEFDLNERIRAVLTDDQKVEFDRLRVLAAMHGGGSPAAAPAPTAQEPVATAPAPSGAEEFGPQRDPEPMAPDSQ